MLNRIQSIVYPTAYGTNENLLICGTVLVIRTLMEVSNSRYSTDWSGMRTDLYFNSRAN